MLDQFARTLHSGLQRDLCTARLLHPAFRLLVAALLIFGCVGEAPATSFAGRGNRLTATLPGGASLPQRRQRTSPQAPSKKPRPTAPSNASSDLPDDSANDPTIVAESRRLEAQRLEEQQRTERELLARAEPAETRSDEMWKGFRQTFPFHSQVIALSEPGSDRSRTLIISEPPPHVTLGNILSAIGGDLLLNHEVKKQTIGYDGWVKDVVVAVKGDDEELSAMLSRLNQRLFFTSYKSYTLKLPVRISAKTPDLNLTVTPEELKQWVVDNGEQFFPVEGGKAETLASLATEQSSGVYVGRQRGLVGWWIPKKRNMYECRVPARQFALDADLVLGALANSSGIFVLGRERIVPVDVLPPLRFETLAMLADVQEGQRGSLAQSYERRRPFAGRIDEGKDWAPILLSPQLRDTEYGSLLNITDQLLKGWSNSGKTSYVNFPYPEPGKYPFQKPLYEHLRTGTTSGSLTYNWNTKGVGYTVDFGSVTSLAFNRSGALPVSYIPDGLGRAAREVVTAEETGYNYFSGLNDPNLVRVVQYAGLYQIFSAFGMAHSTQPVPADSYPDQQLELLTNELYTELRQAPATDIERLGQQTASSISKFLDEEIEEVLAERAEELKQRIDAKIRSEHPEISPGTKEYDRTTQDILNDLKRSMAERMRGKLAEDVKHQLEQFRLNRAAEDPLDAQIRRAALSQYASLRRMPQRYAEAADRRAQGWIHTPVVVISWNEGARAVGGHNLDARVTKIVADGRVPQGTVDIDSRGNLVVNPADLPRARGFARNVERNELMRKLAVAVGAHDRQKFSSVLSEMGDALSRTEAVAPRPRENALHLSSSVPPNRPPINKPPVSAGEPGPSGGAGWGGGGREARAITIVGDREPNAIQFALADDGRYNLQYGRASRNEVFELRALTHEDAVDAAVWQAIRGAKPGEPVVIEFKGVPEHKASATLRTMEIRMSESGTPVELIALVRDGGSGVPSEGVALRQYNFGQARVEVSEIQSLGTGELQQSVSLNVPAADNSTRSVSFTSEVRFSKWTPRNVVTAVGARVSRAFGGLATRWNRLMVNRSYRANVNDYNRNLTQAVRKIKVRTKLDFDVKTKVNVISIREAQGLGDIYIGE